MLNKSLFAQTMTMLFELYEKEQTKPLMDIYYGTLKDMDDADFSNAVTDLLKTRVYPTMPKPAEILERSQAVKIIDNTDPLDEEANRLIDMIRATEENIFNEAGRKGMTFDDLLELAKFNLPERDNAILNNIAPHYGLKKLIGNINVGWNSLERLNAFKKAIRNYGKNDALAINGNTRLRIKR